MSANQGYPGGNSPVATTNYIPLPSIAFIRYKDGRDKMIELPDQYFPINFPSASNQQFINSSTGLHEIKAVMSEVNPMQMFRDRNGGAHWIRVEEILDISIEVLNE